MLFAYTLSGDIVITRALAAELRSAVAELANEHLPPGHGLSFVWHRLQPDALAAGTFLRGYEQVQERAHAIWLVHALRLLSRRFPQITVSLSGWGELPVTELKNGEFMIFGDRYERALASVAGWRTAEALCKRIPS